MQTWKLKKRAVKKTKSPWSRRVTAIVMLLLTVLFAGYAFPSYWNNAANVMRLPGMFQMEDEPYRLGLDLKGGTHLVYEADMSQISQDGRLDALEGVKNVIERRVNAFGVSEPLVQTTTTGNTYRLMIELAGVSDVKDAINQIGKTPVLEFKVPNAEFEQAVAQAKPAEANEDQTVTLELPDISPWVNTALSGKQLKSATVQFDQQTGAPNVLLNFNSEGSELFGKLTEEFTGKQIAIFLDNQVVSAPVVQQAIYGGQAVITGNFTIDESKLLAQELNAGALPVPINLLSQQTIGPTLGLVSLQKSIVAALIGFALVALFMIGAYRLGGFVAVLALALFAFLNLGAYKLFGVTITLAGIAGFVLSLGIAVDANVLILERFKEEYASGRDVSSALDEAFSRAWAAIRDGNLTTLIAAAVLYWFSSSFIRGFALTLSIGVILSMFTAISVSRIYLKNAVDWKWARKPFLYCVKKIL